MEDTHINYKGDTNTYIEQHICTYIECDMMQHCRVALTDTVY